MPVDPANKDRLLHKNRRYRCGRCGSLPELIFERMSGADCYSVELREDGRVILLDQGGEGEHGGRVWAECSCGYTWTLRSVFSIDDISDRLLELPDA